MVFRRPFSSIREESNRYFNDMDRQEYEDDEPRMMRRHEDAYDDPRSMRHRHEYEEQRRMPSRMGQGDMMSSGWSPSVDVIESEQDIKVTAQVPGMRPDQIDIEVENNALCLYGENRQEEHNDRDNVFIREISYGKFFRRIPLPAPVVADNARASFNNGLLTVILPKSEQTRRQKINIST